MAWQNLLTYDPATVVDVYLNGVLLAPVNYGDYELEVIITGGIIEVAYNQALLPLDARLEALARPSAPVLLPQRLADTNGDPWAGEGTTPFASYIDAAGSPPPVQDDTLGPTPGVTHVFNDEGEFSAVGMGIQFGSGG